MTSGRRVQGELSPLAGMTDLGMRKTALIAAQNLLEKTRPEAASFAEAARAVLVHGWKKNKRGAYVWNVDKWLPLLEAAYERMTASSRRRSRPTMLHIYWNAGMYECAAGYHDPVPIQPFSAYDLAVRLQLLCALQRNEELELNLRAARAILEKLPGVERSYLSAFMSKVCWQRGDIEACKELSQQITDELEVHWEPALLLPIKVSLAKVRRLIRESVQRIDSYEKSAETELNLALPGYRKLQLNAARLRLRRMSRLMDQALR